MYGAGMVQENSLWKEHPACSGTGKRNERPFAKGLLETGLLSLCQKGTVHIVYSFSNVIQS